MVGIRVRDVRGIKDINIYCDFYPNQPNFLVAPNGSGKTSLAAAFDSLNRDRLKIRDKNIPRGTAEAEPYLEIRFDDEEPYSADGDHNGIGQVADTFVINSGLYAKSVRKRFGGKSIAYASVRVPDVVLWEKIPDRVKVRYSSRESRALFPPRLRGELRNLKEDLDNARFLDAVVACDPKPFSAKRDEAAISEFLSWMVNHKESWADPEALSTVGGRIIRVKSVSAVAKTLSNLWKCSITPTLYLNAIQVCRLYESDKAEIKAKALRLEYEETRREIDKLLAELNTSGIELKSRVEGGSLVIEFPERSMLSNGELDVLRFAALLALARKMLKKDRSVLVIDEVFDYLDDANLLVAQHYLLKMMAAYRASERRLYAIILTHLDPSLMQSYRFAASHVSFFPSSGNSMQKGFMKGLIADRDRCQKESRQVYDDISRRYLHYSTDEGTNRETERYLSKKQMPNPMITVVGFRDACMDQLRDYLEGKPYDTFMTCCAIRTAIEKLAYDQLLSDEERAAFDRERGTEQKLRYATACGAEVPESHYLLGSLYNPAMHARGKDGELATVERGLENAIVRNMVRTVCGEVPSSVGG